MAEKERFELSRRLTRPTPLAGAPLHQLEYFSVFGEIEFYNVYNHIIQTIFLQWFKSKFIVNKTIFFCIDILFTLVYNVIMKIQEVKLCQNSRWQT